jgi:hypothetical protein
MENRSNASETTCSMSDPMRPVHDAMNKKQQGFSVDVNLPTNIMDIMSRR